MRKDWIFCNRKILLIFIVHIFAVCVIFSFGCKNGVYEEIPQSKVQLTIADGAGYTADKKIFDVERGSDVEIRLEFLPGYVFDSCDYKNYDYENENERVTALLLKNVRYPSFVNVKVKTTAEGIYYYANGGNFKNTESDYLLEWANAASGRRQNTNTGAFVKRDGYTLIGWNTRADGSGESVGLGSRITLPSKTIVNLYAQWENWLPFDNFEYSENDDGVTLNFYKGGSAEIFTIPAVINGKRVTRIDRGFANGLDLETVILPDTLKRVEKSAFLNCNIKTLYFSDNLEYIVDESFSGSEISTLHINARLAPRYLGTSEVAEFADRMDRLILNRDKKKMIFFAGCSMSYGLDSEIVERAFDGEYEVIDFGTMGETHAGAQIDCITKFLSDGDIFVHAPEQAAPYQLMYSDTMEPNIYLLCEGNFDLITYIDMSVHSGALTAFNIFNSIRLKIEGGSYLDDACLHNEYGDIKLERAPTGKDVSYSDFEYTYEIKYAIPESINRLCNEYDKISSVGAKVMFSFAPVNYHGLTADAVQQKLWERFENIYRAGLRDRGYGVISKAENYLLPGRYFYDTDYHLNDAGVFLRTERLIADIKFAI